MLEIITFFPFLYKNYIIILKNTQILGLVKHLGCRGGIPNSGLLEEYHFRGYPISPHKKRLPHRGRKAYDELCCLFITDTAMEMLYAVLAGNAEAGIVAVGNKA